MNSFSMTAAACLAVAAWTAEGSVTVSVGANAPTYGTTIDFDEVGGPTGVVPADSWAARGVSSLVGGTGPAFVSNLNAQPGFGWLPDSNVLIGSFGVFFEFSTDVTEFSAQVWDNAGPAGIFSGGMLFVVENDGVEVANFFWETPVYGTAGDNWFNVITTDGMVFDRIALVGLAFVGPETIIDNVSFNAVPAPASAGLLVGALGLAGRRRR